MKVELGMRRTVAVLLLALSAAPVHASEAIAITGGRVVTNAGAPIDGGTVLLRGGEVVAVGSGDALPVPAGFRVVDARGRWVTPGIVAGISQLGVAEISSEDSASDVRAFRAPVSAALELEAGLNPQDSAVAIARAAGVTTAIVAPREGRTVFGGQGVVISLGLDRPPVKSRAFQFLAYGEEGARLAGGSRAAAWAEIVHALDAARLLLDGRRRRAAPVPAFNGSQSRDPRLTPEDAEALGLVLKGVQPLLVQVDRASDIRRILQLPRLYPGLRLVLVSANEGWMVADEIARAAVPVITLGLANRPQGFDMLGATRSNAGRLVAAGVAVGLGTPDVDPSFQPRNLPHHAGNLVALGRVPGATGLSWEQAFAAVSLVPAEVFGLTRVGALRPGSVADVVIWSGDPLELSTHVEQLFIGGVPQSLETRQTRLARRYRPGRDRGRLPESYAR